MKHLLYLAFILCLFSCSPKQQNGPVAIGDPVDTVAVQPMVLRNEALAVDPMAADSQTIQTSPDTLAFTTEAGVYLLEPTWYHGDEIQKGWEQLQWYGLFKRSETEFEVRTTEITIQQIHDDIVDNEGEDTGWQVKVHGTDTLPVLLLGGSITLTPRVTTGKRYEYHILKPDSILLLDKGYQVKAFGSYRPYSEESDEKEIYKLMLRGISRLKVKSDSYAL